VSQSGVSHFPYTTVSVHFKQAYSLWDNQLGIHWMGTDSGAKIMGTINLHIVIIGLSILVNSYIFAFFYGNPLAQCKSLGNNFGISIRLIYSGIPFQIYLGNLVLTLQPEMRGYEGGFVRLRYTLYIRGNPVEGYPYYY